MKKLAYRFEALDRSNQHHLIELYAKVFGNKYTLNFINSKFRNEYTGISAQGHFAFKNDRPVAFHGAIPVIMKQGETKELAAQYGDAMTIKSEVGNGLFTDLGLRTDDLLQQKNVQFVWGFPNQNSEYGYVNKLNWKGNERMKCLIIPLSKISKEQLTRKSERLKAAFQKSIQKKLEGLIIDKKPLSSIHFHQQGGVDRSSEFYAYRSFSFNYHLKLSHGLAWIKTEGGLLIGDLEYQSKTEIKFLLQELISLGKELGFHQLVLQASKESRLYKDLAGEHSFLDSWLIGFKDFSSSFDFKKMAFTYGDLDTF